MRVAAAAAAVAVSGRMVVGWDGRLREAVDGRFGAADPGRPRDTGLAMSMF